MADWTPQRLFSLEEANRLIPTVSKLVERLRQSHGRLVEEARRLAPSGAELDLQDILSRHAAENPALAEQLEAMQSIVAQIEKLGCEFKGLEIGLVDFPAIIGNEVAFLCWKYGETSIKWWHTLDGGYEGRRPLREQDSVGRLN